MASLSSPPAGVVVAAERQVGRMIFRVGLGALIAVLVVAGVVGSPVMLVVAALIILAVGFFYRDTVMATVQWHRPEIVLPAPTLNLGAQFDLAYRRRPRRVRDIGACTVTCQVVCEERVTYRQGTTTRTDTADVYRTGFVGSGEGTANGLAADVAIEIPAHAGAPTFDLGNNEVRWYLVARIDGPSLPGDEYHFELSVAPTLDAAHQPGINDS